MTAEMKEKLLRSLVQGTLDARLADGLPVEKSWLIHEVIAQKSPAEGEDADFYGGCAYYAVKDVVGRLLRELKEGEDKDTTQLRLPGHARLQRAYLIMRKGKSIVIPLPLCSDAELRAKANEHRAQSRGHEIHARELDAYVDARVATGT